VPIYPQNYPMETTTSKSVILQIAAKATFLSEHIDRWNNRDIQNQHIQDRDIQNFDKNLSKQRLEYWIKSVEGEEKFKQYIAWDNLDLETLILLLGKINIWDDRTLPSWAKTLEELISSAVDYRHEPKIKNWQETEKTPSNYQPTLAFEDFYRPFILVAINKFFTALLPIQVDSLLTQEAYNALEYDLLQQLVNLGTSTLFSEFEQLRSNYFSETSDRVENCDEKNESNKPNNQIIYSQFINSLLEDGGLDFFLRYPVLARLIATTIDFWVESNIEFLQRLQSDLKEIELQFSPEISIGKVRTLESNLSNFHNNRRSVLALTFTSGTKIIYKPKNLRLDIAFNRLIVWCDRQNISLSLKTLKILDRSNYGWIEFVAHQPCENQTAVKNFYNRAGILLCLMYILGAKDCGSENIIANSEHPVLIDADILMQPVSKNENSSAEWLENSVLKMGYLPAWEGNTFSASTRDFSTLGNIYPQQVNASREWKSINTDEMDLVATTTIIPSGTNAVIWEGKVVSPRNYLAEIIDGFREIYNLLIQNKEIILSPNSPISEIKFLKSRFIPHASLVYAIAAKNSLNPQVLSDGIQYSILINSIINKLNCSLLEIAPNQETWKIFNSQTASLQQQDIPSFSVNCDSVDLHLYTKNLKINNSIEHFFHTSSYQRLINKLENLDEQDLSLQIKLIRSSFDAKFAHLRQNDATLQGNLPQFNSITKEELLQEAMDIGNQLISNSIEDNCGCNWIYFDYIFKANRYNIQKLDDSLYVGRTGVALFLAALAKITGEKKFKQIALYGLLPIQNSLKQAEIREEIHKSELGLLGTGGIIYSLVKISQFLAEPNLLEIAKIAAKQLTTNIINNDNKLDMIFGVAGAIPGLLNLYSETDDQEILDIATACGNHLLKKRSHTNHRAWVTIESEKPLTGFSHGAAGISLSLLRLYDATHNIAFLEAAQEAIEYEQSVFNSSVQNWPDFRMFDKNNQVNFLHTWCHGSAGIGLARLAGLPILSTENIYSDINIALDTTKKFGLPNKDIDHLCCGHMGRVELFILASQKLDTGSWINTAFEQTGWVINRQKMNRAYYFDSHLHDYVYSPSFYRGTAGIGYQLLRLAFPDILPSVLICE
jgi:type 2 lantibiotic biosynthesis protein LanM